MSGLREEGINLFFMTLADLDGHPSLHHVDAQIQWGCINCQMCFTKLHGARCHLPKCKGTSASEEGSYKCEACPMSFDTQRRLSTYERHAHPVVRNEKRRSGPPSTRLWTAEEVNLLKELNETYKNRRFPNVEISKFLITKTAEQIKKKRQAIKTSGEEATSQEVIQ